MSYHKLNCYVLEKKKTIVKFWNIFFLFIFSLSQRPLEEREVALPSLEANKIRHYKRNWMET